MKELMDLLKNPPKEYRAVPFWSWNDKLDSDTLKWQIREMDKAGLGGYFMHARGGLQTEYLSEDWMELTKDCIEEGSMLGMNSWCYDENGWPSGFAGGIVPAMGDYFHVRWLEIAEKAAGSIRHDDNILGIYRLEADSHKIINLDPSALNECGDEKVYVISHKSNPYYIDILNPKVMRSFIDVTHEKYYEKFKSEFGKGMTGFFTDEPQISRAQFPWSYIFPQEFQRRFGYDIVDNLAALFIECEGYEKIRYDFWTTVNDLFVTSFGKQIYDWCEAHNCKLTGHALSENSIYSQMLGSAGVMPFYRYLHIPGIDWLGRTISSPVIPKQVSSVANQLGKKFVLTETFALCGWDVSFEELKWIAEWQYVNGVNLMCQHLEGYSLRGFRKRDYPPSLFYQQSWWDEYKLFNDYFARLGVLLTSGKDAAEVLLIHPMKSGWIAYDHNNSDKVDKLDKDFVHATETLSGLHIDHHYGDETIIKEYGKVEGDKFIIGQCSYNIVIMPSMITIDRYTLELMDEFINNGGTVISFGDFPMLCEGNTSSLIDCVKEKVIHIDSRDNLYNLLQQKSTPAISVSDCNGEIEQIHCLKRDLGDSQVFYFVNHDQIRTFNPEVVIKAQGSVRKLSVENAEKEDVAYSTDAEATSLTLEFLPMQSHILIFTPGSASNKITQPQKEERVTFKDSLTIEDMDMNSLTLDYCSYCIDGGEWNGPIHTIRLMDLLLNLKRECDISLKFNFDVSMDISKNKDLLLAVEAAKEFEIFVNDNPVKYTDIGWWKDISFKKIDIKPYVQNGTNEIILKRKFYQSQKVYDVLFGDNVLETERNKLTYDVELESIYVVGDFGVTSKSGYTYGDRKAVYNNGPFVISDKPSIVKTGSLVEQGFCFFAGVMSLSQNLSVNKEENKRIILDISKVYSGMSKLYVNDKFVKALLWAPYEADITEYLNDGDNKIVIQLFASNRNLLGPHHNICGESYSVGPSTFTDKAGWSEGNETGSIWADRYCFVKFGLE